MDCLSPNSSRVSTVPNGVFVFAAIFALAHTPKTAKFPVVGPCATTGATDCVFDERSNVLETHEQAGDLKEP
jgi:hypothetical protein